jgi:hypothetical protein
MKAINISLVFKNVNITGRRSNMENFITWECVGSDKSLYNITFENVRIDSLQVDNSSFMREQ